MASYRGPLNKHAAYIACVDNFNPLVAKMGAHKPLGVVILNYGKENKKNPKEPVRMLAEHQFNHLDDAIRFVEQFIPRHQEWQPSVI